MKFEDRIIDNTIYLYLDSELFSRDAIFKCLYWYSDKFDIALNKKQKKCFEVILKPLPTNEMQNDELKKLFYKVKQDFIDFNLRDIVTKETKNIRELLIAKAFSQFDTEEPPPEVSESN